MPDIAARMDRMVFMDKVQNGIRVDDRIVALWQDLALKLLAVLEPTGCTELVAPHWGLGPMATNNRLRCW